MSFAVTTIAVIGALTLISVSLLSLAKHLNRKEHAAASPSWRIIDGEYIRLDSKEEA